MGWLGSSVGDRLSHRPGKALWLVLGLFLSLFGAAFGGCVSDDPHTIVPSIGGMDATGGSSQGGAGQGGQGQCTSPDECAGQDTTCAWRTCDANVCGTENAPVGTACTENAGVVCDGLGQCVECVTNDHCPNNYVCDQNTCVLFNCTDGVQNGTETDIDCGGLDCLPCENGSTCLDDPDCESNFCDEGAGGAGGSGTGGAGGAGGSPSTGICTACDDESDCTPYACDNGICFASCTTDVECASDHWCENSVCVPKSPIGDPCTVGNSCTSGFCADGVCCNAACQGGCQACDTPVAGTCTLYVQGTPGSPSCAPFVCDGTNGTCPVSCTTNATCALNYYCSGGNCLPQQTNGQTCTTSSECQSGFCVDGYCCNTSCVNSCDACDVTGNLGVCTPKLDGSPGVPPCNPYLCNGAISTCPNFCTVSVDCISGYYCGNSQCLPLKANGSSCGSGAECTSGFCADGVCCNSACGNACQSCNLTGNIGTCTTVPSGSSGTPSCSPYVCNGTSVTCPTSCSSNANCSSGNFCDTNGQCAGKKANGATCTSLTECQSNNCVDGYCCNTACGNNCDACNLSGSEGTCTVYPDGSSGNPSCGLYLCNGVVATCPTSCVTTADCSSGNYCNASNQCVTKKSNGTTCANAVECQSGNCVDGYCCNSSCGNACDACNVAPNFGTCSPVADGGSGSPSCAPYLCDGASLSCPSSCATNADCATGNYCSSGNQCVAKKTNGQTCGNAGECQSGFCVNGYCCNSACSSSCDACNVTGNLGTCTVNSAGSTGAPSCAPYVCNGLNAACPSSCTTTADCTSGNYCNGTQCVATKPNGTTCGTAIECQSGFCVDGYCCNSACNGGCNACNLSGTLGLCSVMGPGSIGSPTCAPYVCDGMFQTCPTSCTSDANCASGNYCNGTQCLAKKANGTTCGGANECASGFCVDGYCCNGTCGSSCDACNVTGNLGSCTLLPSGSSGAPTCSPYLCSGSSASCPGTCFTSADCATGFYCNGTQCVAKKANGATCAGAVECSSNFCVDGYCCNSACTSSCDACNVTGNLGTCTTAPAGSTGNPSCSPYVCNGTAITCPSSCTTNANCSSGNTCVNNVCTGLKVNGSPCANGGECQSGFCVDGYCCNSSCGASCDGCNVTGLLGQCSPVPDGQSGNPSCSPYLCNGSSATCPSSCVTSADCASTHYCNASNQCVLKKTNGTTCAAAAECQSTFCVDGYCCNNACSGGCNACNLTGFLGTCSVMAGGSTGSPTCSPYVCDGMLQTCPASCVTNANCASGFYCSGSTCVAKKANGLTCATGGECQSGNCIDGYCCNTTCGGSCDACNLSGSLGSCTNMPGGSTGSPSCSPYLCNGSSASCPGTCSSDANCASTFYCSGTSCVAKKVNGQTCTGANQCQSGNCIDGYCCNTACTGSCDVCNNSGSLGTCSPAANGSSGSPSCSPYVCNGASTSCPASCTTSANCVSTHYCSGNLCVVKKSNGATCAGAGECQSGFCVDGYCCNGACGSSCDACNNTGNLGSCTLVTAGSSGSPTCSPYLCNGVGAGCPSACVTNGDCISTHYCDAVGACVPKKSNGTTCAGATECQSGFCVDDYCCNSACTGSCNQCNKSGALGTCSVSSAGTAGNPSCTPYVCDGMFQTCPSTCTTNAQCAGGYVCTGGLCVPSGSCSAGTFNCDGNSGNGCECTVGTGCCGTSCQVQHMNGLGQNFYDCVPLGTYDSNQAFKACAAFSGSTALCTDFGNVCNTTGPPNNDTSIVCSNLYTDCACWSYAGASPGLVYNDPATTCFCVLPGDPTWN